MVTTRRLQLVLTLSVAMAAIGCKDDPNLNFIADFTAAGPTDLAGADLTGVAIDMTVVPDQAVPPDLIGADLTVEPDLSEPEDMTALPDLIEPDLVVDPTVDMLVLPDLIVAAPPDMLVLPDMVDVPDMLVLPDMVVLPDMIVLSDMVLGFGVSSAVATSATTVEVTFNDTVKDATVAPSDFTISGLNVTGASVSGNKVTLTTDPQSEAANYLVEVTGEILDGTDRPISAGTSAAFTGFVPPAPSITGFTPTSVVRGVTGLTITGTALKPGGGTPTVTIGGVAQTVASSTDTSIVITTVDPATPTGAAQPVFVATADGTDTENIEVLGDFLMESANVLSPTTVVVMFNRAADAGTVSAARFSVAGLTVDTAVAAGAVVTLTFSTPLVDATSYALYVTTDLKDTFGASAVATHIVTFNGAAPTNFVVAVVGNGSTTGFNTVPLKLERRSIADPTTLIDAITLPSTAAAVPEDPKPFTVLYGNSAEASLNRSIDGKLLTIGGYQIAAGTPASTGSTPPVATRAVAAIDAGDFALPSGVDTSTTLGTAFTSQQLRSAVSDGTNVWLTGGTSTIYRTTLTSVATPTGVALAPTTGRVIGIHGGQLYVTFSNGSSQIGIHKVGEGLPTATGTTATTAIDAVMTGGQPYSFAVFDLTDEPGIDHLYLFDETAGIKRFVKASGVWTLNHTFATGVRHGTCYLNNGDVVCIASMSGSSNGIYVLTDTGHASSATTVGTVRAPAAANYQYRGLAIAPQP